MLEVVKALDSTGQTAIEWAKALEALTLRTDIQLLTMLAFNDIFSTRNLLRDWRVWCPLCYESSKDSQKVVYEPLLWRLRIVKFCSIHNFPLQSSCKNCEKDKHPVLVSANRSGCCHYCKQWLGCSETEKVANGENNQFETFVSKFVGEVLSANPYSTSTIFKQNTKASLEFCLKYYTGGNISKFARLTSVSARIIANWRKGTNLFRIELLAQICWVINVSLREFLEGNVIGAETRTKKDSTNSLKKTEHRKGIDLIWLKQLLEDAINVKLVTPSLKQLAESSGHDSGCFKRHFPELCLRLKEKYNIYKETERKAFLIKMKSALDEFPPPSVATLSRRLNRCVPALYKSFPKICYEVTKRHKDYKNTIRKTERSNIIKEVENIVIELLNNGIRPSQKNVSQLMSKPGQMSNETARTALRKTCLKLNSKN